METYTTVKERYIFDEKNFSEEFEKTNGHAPSKKTILSCKDVTNVINQIVERELNGNINGKLPSFLQRK